jgi:Ca2+/H+ antiporter, TMEM165/GDT1 family
MVAGLARGVMSMNMSKVVFGFFVLLAVTLNFGFFIGDIDNPDHHDVYELFAALVVGLIATVLKFGERSQMGAILLASSLVVNLHLIAAVVVWAVAVHVAEVGLTPKVMASIVSLSGGALLANLVSLVLLTLDTAGLSRR